MAERQRESVWVTIDAAELGPQAPVGVLHHERVRGKPAVARRPGPRCREATRGGRARIW